MSMISQGDTVLIEDDEDDIEIVEIQNNDEEHAKLAGRKVITFHRQGMPAIANGYTKPSYSIPQLITQVLAICPGRRATALHICELIATKHPYFKFCPVAWRTNVYMALTKRKKFFVVVGKNVLGEFYWSFNPSFEKYMLDKWVPKYMKKRSLDSQPPESNTTSSLLEPNGPLNEPLSPVIVSTTSLSQKSNLDVLPSVDSGPEFALADPDLTLPESESSVQDHNPWEPEVTVSENMANPKTSVPGPNTQVATCLLTSLGKQGHESAMKVSASTVTVEPRSNVLAMNSVSSNQLLTQLLAEDKNGHTFPWKRKLENSISKNREPVQRKPYTIEKPAIPKEAVREKKDELFDFTLENLDCRHSISNDEITYRLEFHKEHPLVEKFRLHCTACDRHLGTSAMHARSNVRLHPLLGVLLCTFCYNVYKTANKNSKFRCCWCCNESSLFCCCSVCHLTFCKECLVRNFGLPWYEQRSAQNGNWGCMVCDSRPIWPHRAVGYFLYRHYSQLKKKKNLLTQKMRISRIEIDFSFYMRDLSVCCKAVSSSQEKTVCKFTNTQLSTTDTSKRGSVSPLSTPVLPSSVSNNDTVLPNSVFSNQTDPLLPSTTQQTLVFDKQPSNNIYVQTTAGLPALTLNTGTQYIHNVYPERNYVVVQSPTSSSTSSTSVHTSVPVVHVKSKVSVSKSAPILPVEPEPVFPVVSKPVLPLVPEPVTVTSISSLVPILPESPVDVPVSTVVSSVPNIEPLLTPTVIPSNLPAPYGPNSVLPDSVSASNSGFTQCDIPCVQPNINIDALAEKLVSQSSVNSVQSATHAKAIMAAKERIERRPMPKSKKQSLLRAVLMNESIESMKRHLKSMELQTTNVNTNVGTMPPSDKAEMETSIEPASVYVTQTQINESNEQQHFEEPILKSIIETATERLLNLQKKQNLHSTSIISNGSSVGTTDNGSLGSPLIKPGAEEIVDLSDDSPSPIIKTVNSNTSEGHIPKIKIRTLKELQELQSIDDDADENINKKVNKPDIKECDEEPESVNTQDLEDDNAQQEVNVTSLKRGIIEASRTIINTQKKLKELAKVISSNLSYQPEQAVDLITKFQDILKCCRKQIDVIDGNIKNQFGHLLPCRDIDVILESIKNGSEDNGTKITSPSMKGRKITSKLQNKRAPMKDYSDCEPPVVVTRNDVTNTSDVIETDSINPEPWQGTFIDKVNVSGLGKKITIRQRDLVDFNTLGKKIILGTPEVTEEDLEQIPNIWDPPSSSHIFPQRNQPLTKQLVKQQNITRQSYKKKDIWSSPGKRRRKLNKDGSLRKKSGRQSKSVMCDDTPEITSPLHHKKIVDERLRKRNTQSAPKRVSERMHPSSVEYFARLFESPTKKAKDDKSFSFSGYYTIKPCSVVVHRLDPRIVPLLEKRVK